MKINIELEKVEYLEIECDTCGAITSYYAHQPKMELESEDTLILEGVDLYGGHKCKSDV